MRPIKLGPFTPAVASTTAFNAQTFTSTGAATAPTTTSTSDGLAHFVTLTSPVQASLAGVTFTIAGTDADGRAITDVVTGPASASTTTSVKYFKTVATITPSATMGGLLLSIGIAANTISQTIPLTDSVAAAGMTVVVTGTINYTMSETFANVFEQSVQSVSTAITALTTKTTNTSGNADVSATGVFLTVNSFSSGATFTVWLNQSTAGRA